MPHAKLLFLVATIMFFSSCSQRLYYPDRANVPAFRQGGDVMANVSLKSQFGGGDVTAFSPAGDLAYAPINHLGIIASYRDIDNKAGYLYPTYDKPGNYSSNNIQVIMTGHRFEGGAGYFTGLGSKGVFEGYGGYGNGVLTGKDYFTTNYNRFFVQTEAGFRNKVVSVMGGVRVAMQKYYNFQSPDSTLRYNINVPRYGGAPIDFTSENFLFVEPFFNLELGYNHFFFNMQIGVSGQTGTYSTITSDFPVYCSLGLTYHLSPELKYSHKRNTER